MSLVVQEIRLKEIRPNRLNPRLEINIEALNELSESIKQSGLVQPLVIRPVRDGYEVVVGERRYRACQQAGLDKVPAIIREYTDNEVIEVNLIENTQREDLSAVEKGNSCKRLLEEYPEKYPNLRSIAERIGMSEITVGQWMGLVSAPTQVQRLVAPTEKRGVPTPKGKIDYDTALSIVRKIKEPKRQIQVARELAKRPIYGRAARKVISEIGKEPEKPIKELITRVVEEPYELPFRLSHMDPILKGVKTQTSRKGIPDPKVKEGAIVHAAVWEPRFARLRVTEIERKRLGDFTEEDAKREGGYTLREFRRVWKKIHGEWKPDDRVYVIHFRRMD